ncbi:MAG: KH domain-containing protein [Eubacteriales bacterium]|nr:KH domain-containing protein [Eubacteriales bacterium]MDD4716500.1 KH domain-containing protein [Eubacteriales bacterium]NCU25396.1 KH domain-containing protein [Candidatus Nomurabacteria bacterium]
MKELLKTIASELVNDPEKVSVKQIDQGNTTVLELSVAPEDMGKVIGKGGRRAQAIRSVIKAKATRDGKRVIVDIVD